MGKFKFLQIPVRLFSLSSSRNKTGKYKIIMARHGESVWNEKNLFCGWYDAALTEKGEEEARQAGKILMKGNYEFDMAYTSVLQRAIRTLELILEETKHKDIPICKNWRLNERHYGALTGMNKSETSKKYGENQVQIWRRSYDIAPPPMQPTHQYYKEIRLDKRYQKHGPTDQQWPDCESLQLTIRRTLPYWFNVITPQLKLKKKIIVVAHGNSLRGIIKYLYKMNKEQIMELNLPTGIPFEVILDKEIRPVEELRFLGDLKAIQAAIDRVANQGKVK